MRADVDRYSELKDFFDVLPNILAGPESVFSFWNGLGATSKLCCIVIGSLVLTFCALDPTIYDVASNLAALHLDDVGMQVRSSIMSISPIIG